MQLEEDLKTPLRIKSGKFYVYVMECKGFYKIGMTDHLKRRISGVNTASPFDVVIIRAYEFRTRKKANDFENHLHRAFKDKRLRSGITGEFKEWFSINLMDLNIIDGKHDKLKRIKERIPAIINDRIRPAYEFSKLLKRERLRNLSA